MGYARAQTRSRLWHAGPGPAWGRRPCRRWPRRRRVSRRFSTLRGTWCTPPRPWAGAQCSTRASSASCGGRSSSTATRCQEWAIPFDCSQGRCTAGDLSSWSAPPGTIAMRRQAAEISAVGSGDRLSVPPAGDELGRLGVTLNEMLARLERSLARERRFVADASHELRTPLALLKAELELARREGRSVEELSAAVGSAADEADRLIRLAEDLLVLAHLDEEDLPVHAEGLELDDLLAGATRAFERRASEAGRRLVVNAPGGVTLEADRLRLEQAVGNLLDNALRHGGGTIELAAAVAGDRVELHVRDEGAGFPPDLLEHAFERFSRAVPARSRGHAGLGLAIVDSVAKAHGGKVGAVNRARGGADVWIELPLTAVSSRVAINAAQAVDEGGRR